MENYQVVYKLTWSTMNSAKEQGECKQNYSEVEVARSCGYLI